MLYTVKWEIEVDAECPRDAALQAMSMMPRDPSDPDDGATVFEVVPWHDTEGKQPGGAVFVDLSEQEGD